MTAKRNGSAGTPTPAPPPAPEPDQVARAIAEAGQGAVGRIEQELAVLRERVRVLSTRLGQKDMDLALAEEKNGLLSQMANQVVGERDAALGQVEALMRRVQELEAPKPARVPKAEPTPKAEPAAKAKPAQAAPKGAVAADA